MSRLALSVFSMLIGLIVSIQGCKEMGNSTFESMRISRSATITLNGTIDEVLPLFGAREEQKWAPHWQPEFIYPRGKPDELNNVFKTETKGHGSSESTVSYWVMTEYSKELGRVSYAIFSEHNITTISIQCDVVNESTTSAEVEYLWTSLDAYGNKLIEHKSESIFSDNLADWEDAINGYLRKS